MIKSYWKLPLLLIILAIQLIVPAGKILRYQNTLKKGTPYKFRVKSYDLKKLEMGRYIYLNYIFDYPADKMIDPLSRYGVLTVNNEGYAELAEISMTAPDSSKDFILISMRHNTPYIDFNRYYIDSRLSVKSAQGDLSRLLKQSAVIQADLRVYKGRAVIENIFLDGIPLIDALLTEKSSP